MTENESQIYSGIRIMKNLDRKKCNASLNWLYLHPEKSQVHASKGGFHPLIDILGRDRTYVRPIVVLNTPTILFMKSLFILLAFCCAVVLFDSHLVQAQSLSNSEEAIYTLTDAGFLDAYKDHRAEIEQYVALFKARKDEYTVEDLIKLKSAYKRTAEAYEDFIYNVRNDLLDKKTRKRMRKNPEAYVTLQMEELEKTYREYYQGWFHPTYAAICEPNSNLASNRASGGGNGLSAALIAPVTQATMQVIEFLDKKNDRDIDAVKKVLDSEWIDPHRFTPWEEI